MPRCILLWVLTLLFFIPLTTHAQGTPTDLPLLRLEDFVYEGAFRVPASKYGASEMNYAEGPLAYSAERQSIFIVGHNHQQAIAEFKVPQLVKSSVVTELKMAGAPIQPFSTVLGRASGGNPQDLNRIGGLRYFSSARGPELLVNAYEYYDAAGDSSQTTLAVRDADALASSTINGYFTFAGGAGHTSGWMSPVPPEWRQLLGGSEITGQSSGIPIISRTSVGPSAFAFDPAAIVANDNVPSPIPTVKLLDFSLSNPLHADLSNTTRTNDLWTHLSRAVYGFIVPGTRTYATFGHSGGHESGVCYKCTQNNGNSCGGYCSYNANDNYHFYWLWDVNDLLKVKRGEIPSHSVRPYDRGKFPTPFKTNSLGGGSFDPVSGILYLSVLEADRAQGTYSNPPVIVAYKFNAAARPAAPRDLRVLQSSPS